MWGRHVDSQLHEAVKKAKNDQQAQSKAMMAMRTLMQDPDTKEEESETPKPVSSGQFRDPAGRTMKE